ncbi:hypothetical protein AcV5_001922 [Taiwanofungus camphoratus]|nr:hypothetical protein AcV5_001922 [Antrodia cinnamomea]KAI0925449.1 hypothetical protein AcV7_005699 [Antrodia cinnamomea]
MVPKAAGMLPLDRARWQQTGEARGRRRTSTSHPRDVGHCSKWARNTDVGSVYVEDRVRALAGGNIRCSGERENVQGTLEMLGEAMEPAGSLPNASRMEM